MRVLYRIKKGGISHPVLAILTFAVLLVVGVAILMYFYVLAPQASKQSNLAIIGEPIISYKGDNHQYVLTITVKNLGTDTADIISASIIVGGSSHEASFVNPSSISSSSSDTITVTWNLADLGGLTPNQLYTVVLQTSYGNFEFQAAYRGPQLSGLIITNVSEITLNDQGTPGDTSDDTYDLTVTLVNLEGSSVTISDAKIVVDSTEYSAHSISPTTINADQSASVSISWLKSDVGDLTDGTQYTIKLDTSIGTLEFQATFSSS